MEAKENTMANLFINEFWVNASENHGIGESGIYETWADEKEISALYQSLLKDFGKPKVMYKEYTNGKDLRAGWVFTKREKYTDSKETYLQETWVSVYRQNEKGEFVNYWRTEN